MKKMDQYEGQVLEGKIHGKGKLTTANGIIVEGFFENGRLEGEATVALPDGRKYLLQVKDGKCIKQTVLQGKTMTPPSTKIRSPYQPGPGPKHKPKVTRFFFLGFDFGDEAN